jgi:hypothetical protein
VRGATTYTLRWLGGFGGRVVELRRRPVKLPNLGAQVTAVLASPDRRAAIRRFYREVLTAAGVVEKPVRRRGAETSPSPRAETSPYVHTKISQLGDPGIQQQQNKQGRKAVKAVETFAAARARDPQPASPPAMKLANALLNRHPPYDDALDADAVSRAWASLVDEYGPGARADLVGLPDAVSRVVRVRRYYRRHAFARQAANRSARHG